jgi:hypothetical protein
MNKFKIGDKVKVIKTEEIGTIVKIKATDFDIFGCSNIAYLIEFENDRNYWYTVHDIELVQEILTEEEKNFLSTVIKPFKDRIISIRKQEKVTGAEEFIRTGGVTGVEEFIEIFHGYGYPLDFPKFEEGKYYKNMEVGKEYTLEELGL